MNNSLDVDLAWSLQCPDGKLRRQPCEDQFFLKPDYTDCGREGCPGGKHECVPVLIDKVVKKPKPTIRAEKPEPPKLRDMAPPVGRDPIEYVVIVIFMALLVILGTGVLWFFWG